MLKLGFGLMRLPVIDNDNGAIDMPLFTKMADEFIKSGGKYFDTAYFYHKGKSEEAFREAVAKRYPREGFIIADKMPLFKLEKAEQLDEIFNLQLTRCGVDYFDYYLLHNVCDEHYKKAVNAGAFEYINRLKEEGRAKKIGFSFHGSPELLTEVLNKYPFFDVVQLQLNYIDWDDINVQSHKCYDIARNAGKEVIVMEPVKGGALVKIPEKALKCFTAAEPEMSAASWAIRYCASLDGIVTVLSGMSTFEQLNDNLGFMREFKPMTEGEYNVLNSAIEIIRETKAVPCTGCRYCADDCPCNIPIPEIFSLINDMKRFSASVESYKWRYEYATAGKGKASDCIECGMCESLCPQHISIPEEIKKAAEMFE